MLNDLSPYRAAEDRFWEKVEVRGAKECWPWTGSTTRGYGTLYIDGKNVRATRIAWSLRYRVPFPDELHACHVCDNPGCCNPEHLWPGTRSQNSLDASRKGRLYRTPLPAPAAANMAKTHCKRGHTLSGDNLYITTQGNRSCRACKGKYSTEWSRKFRASRAQAITAPQGGNHGE